MFTPPNGDLIRNRAGERLNKFAAIAVDASLLRCGISKCVASISGAAADNLTDGAHAGLIAAREDISMLNHDCPEVAESGQHYLLLASKDAPEAKADASRAPAA